MHVLVADSSVQGGTQILTIFFKMNVYYITSIHYMSFFLLYFIQPTTELVRITEYQFFNVLYISQRYFIIFVIFCSVWNWRRKYVSDFHCSVFFFKMFSILPHFIQY
jgi:hypothetical protein